MGIDRRGRRPGHSQWRLGLAGALILAVGPLLTACGSSGHPTAFHPAAATTSATPSPSSSPSLAIGANGLVEPPFGRGAHVAVTSWKPRNAAEAAAVRVAKNFAITDFYALYTGDQTSLWTPYVHGSVRPDLVKVLDVPSNTTESFTGTVRDWRMSAAMGKGLVEVTQCFDDAASRNTSLAGKVLPKKLQNTPDENYYSVTYVLARTGSHGQWQIITIQPTIYYPRAQECKP